MTMWRGNPQIKVTNSDSVQNEFANDMKRALNLLPSANPLKSFQNRVSLGFTGGMRDIDSIIYPDADIEPAKQQRKRKKKAKKNTTVVDKNKSRAKTQLTAGKKRKKTQKRTQKSSDVESYSVI